MQKLWWILLIAFANFVIAEELFQVRWQADKTKIDYRLHMEGEHEYPMTSRLGPQAIAVDGKRHVYVLNNLQQQILVFNSKGKFLRRISCQADGCGLAVSPQGDLAVFSPSSKVVTWINGELAGKTATAPASFAALSQVWYRQGSWWARCGWQTALLHGKQGDYPLAATFTVQEKQLVLRLGKDNYATLATKSDIANTWAIGSAHRSKRIYVALKTPVHTEIFTCDLDGNRSQSVRLQQSWTDIFCPYTIAPDGNLYEMVTTPSGLTIYRWKKLAKLSRKVPVSRKVPQKLRQFFKSANNSSAQSRATTQVASYIYVYFTNEGTVQYVNLQDYLQGVVSAEIYGSWHLEAHKAMAIAARTYAVARTRHPETSPAAKVCTSTHCQAWTSSINANAQQGVNATNQLVIYYNGSRITEPLYFAHCNGNTRNSEDYNGWNYVSYLRSVPCSCGHTSYYGHGVGACQWGLQSYALQGWNYTQILQHYYTGVTVSQ